MTKSVKADSLFQIFIKDFAQNFGIEDPDLLETQKREIIPESVQIDTVVSFPDDFDFTKLQDRIFPFWGKENVIEYKAHNDRLTPRHVYQYGLTELGILTTHLMSEVDEDDKEKKGRTERKSLSQRAAKEYWQRLKRQGALHACCTTIISTIDPIGIRKGCGFERVDDYEHLAGALYRRVIWEDAFAGSVVVYLVVLNELPVHPLNAPLLLLSTGNKFHEFCMWLLETHEGITIQEQQYYMLYLAGYSLVQDKEVIRKMRQRIGGKRKNEFYMIELMAEDYADEIDTFYEEVTKVIYKTDFPIEAAQVLLGTDSPMGVAQKALQADSPMDVAQKALQADSPIGAAQKMLQADSPEDAALNFIQNEEQMERVMERFQQRNREQLVEDPQEKTEGEGADVSELGDTLEKSDIESKEEACDKPTH